MASSSQSSYSDALDVMFAGLKNRNHETRLQAAIELKRYVSKTVSELSSDATIKLWDHISTKVSDLMHSRNNDQELGALLAIEHLLQVDADETMEERRNLFRFYNYVKTLLPNYDVNIMIAASKILGKIVGKAGSAFGEGFMDQQIYTAIQLLEGDKQESSRYAGVLMLKEFARNNQLHFYSHIRLVFEKILVPIRDVRVIVREGAAELLAACLEIIAHRERSTKSPYLVKILQDAQSGLKMTQPEIIHGSLLTYRELFLHGGMFMKDNFSDAAESVMRFKAHKDNLVRKMVVAIIPTLASYDTTTFSEYFLHKAMGHLLTQLEKPTERNFGEIKKFI